MECTGLYSGADCRKICEEDKIMKVMLGISDAGYAFMDCETGEVHRNICYYSGGSGGLIICVRGLSAAVSHVGIKSWRLLKLGQWSGFVSVDEIERRICEAAELSDVIDKVASELAPVFTGLCDYTRLKLLGVVV